MNTQNYKLKLKEEKKLLEGELSELGKVDKTGDWEATPDNENTNQDVPDEGDLAERSEDYEERSSKLNLLETRLSDINKAIEKIEGESYGICENCKNEIEEDRLEVNPAARTCKECMEKII